MFQSFRALQLTTMVAICAAFSGVASAQNSQITFDPAATTVAVFPVINLGAEKDANFKAGQTKAASESLHKQFADRGFKVLDDKIVEEALAAAKIDLNDEEQHSRQNMLKIGDAAKADLAVFVVINKTSWKNNQNFFTNAKEGHAKITIWLLDVKHQAPILSAKPMDGKHSEAEVFRNSVKPSEQIMKACAQAVKQVLADTLKPYPIIVQK